jgi:hypothetical protein
MKQSAFPALPFQLSRVTPLRATRRRAGQTFSASSAAFVDSFLPSHIRVIREIRGHLALVLLQRISSNFTEFHHKTINKHLNPKYL